MKPHIQHIFGRDMGYVKTSGGDWPDKAMGRWGNWRITDQQTLRYDDDDHNHTEIDLEELNAAEFVDWLYFYLRYKDWLTPEQIGYLCLAVTECCPQFYSNSCP